MASVLYYSNYCNNCKKMIKILSKSDIKNKIHFLNIDKRIVENGKTYILLENSTKVLLPKIVSSVPTLFLINKNKIIVGDDIYQHIKPREEYKTKQSTQFNGEPLAFSLSEMGTIMSDNYSYLDQNSDDLSAKGNGGMRQMHSFVSIDHKQDSIETPPEDYEPDKVKETDLTKMMEQRQQEITINK